MVLTNEIDIFKSNIRHGDNGTQIFSILRAFFQIKNIYLSEAMIFGLSNSLTFNYILPGEILNPTNYAIISGWPQNILEHISSNFWLHFEALNPNVDDRKLKYITRLLEVGNPIILERQNFNIDGKIEIPFEIRPYEEIPHDVLVGIDENRMEICVISSSSGKVETMPIELINVIYKKLVVLYFPSKFPDFKVTVRNSIAASAFNYLNSSSNNSGLNALERFAKEMPNLKVLFSEAGIEVTFKRLILQYNTYKGDVFLRRLFAEFLFQSADVLEDNRILDISKKYKNIYESFRYLFKTAIINSKNYLESLNSKEFKDSLEYIIKYEKECSNDLINIVGRNL